MQHEAVNELFGLVGSFPRPGWVVLDAARDHRFTGELLFDTSPPVRVYFDRGHIYLAERVTDPSLGARLVDAGALSAVQLERGSVRVGDVEHLGRLFERIPNLDRHTVIVTAELMTDECVGWVALQRVPEVGRTPYRHHESGMHLWSRIPGGLDLAPGDPLPAPTPNDVPIACSPPVSAFVAVAEHTETFPDGLIEWDEPSWLDGSQLERELVDPFAEQHRPSTASIPETVARADEPTDPVAAAETTTPPDAAGAPNEPGAEPARGDWVDRLPIDGLPDADPLVSPKPLPRLPVEPADRFELVWPSGEVDEDFGAVESVVGNGHDPDADRIGASTRLARPSSDGSADAGRLEAASTDPVTDADADVAIDTAPDGTDADEAVSDEVVLAVRRAVASIEVGSLAARQRLADASDQYGAASRGGPDHDDSGVPAPGRVAVRSGRNDWSRRTVTRSVFDEPAIEPSAVEPEPAPEPADHRERRAGALRRLIGALRR
jgi:hypothetical protein